MELLKRPNLLATLREMEMGDTLFIQDGAYKENTIRVHSCIVGKQQNKKFKVACIKGGFRIMRVA